MTGGPLGGGEAWQQTKFINQKQTSRGSKIRAGRGEGREAETGARPGKRSNLIQLLNNGKQAASGRGNWVACWALMDDNEPS